MPFYYDVKRTPGTPGTAFTTNGSANTLSTHLRFATASQGPVAKIMGIYGAARFGTAGGAVLYGVRAGAAGSGGTSNTPSKRHPSSPAASLTAFDDATAITPGTTPIQQISVGVAQTGGQGGWVALDADHALTLLPNAGANGNFEVASKANSSSVTFDGLVEFMEM